MRSAMRFATLLALVALCIADHTPLDVRVLTRDTHPASIESTRAAIASRLRAASLLKRDQNHTITAPLEKSWQDSPLFSLAESSSSESEEGSLTVKAAVEVTCKTCYLKGLAVAELAITGNRNLSEVLIQTVDDVGSQIDDLVNQTVHAIDDFYTFDGFTDRLADGLDVSDFLPTNLNLSFGLNLTAIPDVTLSFRFEDLDLYLELSTLLNASVEYEIPLYRSQTIAGGSFFGLDLGALFTVDLLLTADGSLDMTSGVHVRIEDHVTLDIALFGDHVSEIDLKGAKFEFLPVTIESAGVVFTAVLRVGARAALSIIDAWSLAELPGVPDEFTIGGHSASDIRLGGGIEVGVYANVAEFKTNITADEDSDCDLAVIQDYSMVLGATAGAQITLGPEAYGPAVETTTPIYTVLMASVCALTPAVKPTNTVAPTRRAVEDGWVTKTPTTEVVQTVIKCPPTITGQCPVSLQTTERSTTTLTATLSGPEEEMENATYPTPTITSVPFGDRVHELQAITGSPTSYIAPASTDGGDILDEAGDILDEAAETIRRHRRDFIIALSVGVGVGVPLLLAIVVGVLCCCCRRRKKV